jgi:hypothetical protein
VPPELERIVLRALAQAPDDRYATAEQLVLELDELAREHKLKQTSNALSTTVSTLFAAELGAWREARAAGVPLADHLHDAGDMTTPVSESDFIDLDVGLEDDDDDDLDDLDEVSDPAGQKPTAAAGLDEQPTERAPRTVPPGVPRAPSQGIPRASSQGIPRDHSQGVSRAPSQGIPRDPSQTVRDPSPAISRDHSQGIPRDRSQGIPRDHSQGIPRDHSQGIPRAPSQGIPRDHSQGIAPPQSQGVGSGSGSARPPSQGPSLHGPRTPSQGIARPPSQPIPPPTPRPPEPSVHDDPTHAVDQPALPDDEPRHAVAGDDDVTLHAATVLEMLDPSVDDPLGTELQTPADPVTALLPQVDPMPALSRAHPTPSAPFAPVPGAPMAVAQASSAPFAVPPWHTGAPTPPPPQPPSSTQTPVGSDRIHRSWAIIDLPAFDAETFARHRRIVLRVTAGLITFILLLAIVAGRC